MKRTYRSGSPRREVLAASAFLTIGGVLAVGKVDAVNSGETPLHASMSSTTDMIEHVTIRSAKPFEAVRDALEAAVPRLDRGYASLVQAGRAEEARALLEKAAPLSIFGFRDHGTLLQIAGLERKAIQYDIGNPLTASRMTRHVLSAALYAPIRVLLCEQPDGAAAFEYDRPRSTFGRFHDAAVDGVARELDDELQRVLIAAAG